MKIDFNLYTPQQLRDAIEIELRKTNDPKTAAIIAIKRLNKDPEFYAMEKAAGYKYFKKIPDGKGGCRYFYTEAEWKKYKQEKSEGWLAAFMSVFNLKERGQAIGRLEQDYKVNSLDKQGVTWDDWKSHVSAYFANKEKWDALLLKKIEAQNNVKKSDDKKVAVKKEAIVEKKIKDEAKKGRFS